MERERNLGMASRYRCTEDHQFDASSQVKVENEETSLSLSQWLEPSKFPLSYLSLLNEEPTPDEKPKPPLDYVVEKVLLPPSRDQATASGGGIRTLYSASENIGCSKVKPSIRVQSRTNNETYLYSRFRDVPSKQSNKRKNKSWTTECERMQRIDDNINALGELLPHEVEGIPESILNDIIAHVKLMQLQMKELSGSRLGGEPISHPMIFIEGYGHFIHQDQTMTTPLEEIMADLLTNDPDAAASLLESKGLYMMPYSSF